MKETSKNRLPVGASAQSYSFVPKLQLRHALVPRSSASPGAHHRRVCGSRCRIQPGGLTDISRWWSAARTTGHGGKTASAPAGRRKPGGPVPAPRPGRSRGWVRVPVVFAALHHRLISSKPPACPRHEFDRYSPTALPNDFSKSFRSFSKSFWSGSSFGNFCCAVFSTCRAKSRASSNFF